ncbi:hypothetical protein EST38_g146 [Candolleomyces aberdarensis]|uniref:Uncharacterized protein n=1 Tax=Candolleomyces aberdarensis TaxID=2316362 RepID=A0A4Q2E2M6_9AGAR|nr:hypothetical protein EST38_g146 [Candolleomyces aberdarensis]
MKTKKSYTDTDPECQPLLEVDDEDGKDFINYKQKRCSRRCRRAHIWGLSAFVFVYSLTHFIVPAVHTGFQRFRDDHTIPVPGDISLGRCANWMSTEGYPDPAEFYVDVDAPMFVSYGPLAVGEIEVTQANHTGDANKAKVTVSVAFEDYKFLEYVEVCEVRSKDAHKKQESGVGIISVPWLPRQNGRFHVLVELPVVDEASSKRKIRSFRTRMPSFVHTFRDLADVYFQRLEVATTDSPIDAEFVEATDVIITTSNAPIHGTYNVDGDVSLITSSANIDVNLNLRDTAEAKHGIPIWTSARLLTSNGPIRATSNLTTTGTREDYGGKFHITAETSRADIELDFNKAPVEHELNLSASTSLGRAQVTVPPEYDGPWIMEALFPFREVVDTRGEKVPEDPTGRNRSRVLWFNNRGAFEEDGAIVWNRGENRKGQIKLKSTLGRTTIVV